MALKRLTLNQDQLTTLHMIITSIYEPDEYIRDLAKQALQNHIKHAFNAKEIIEKVDYARSYDEYGSPEYFKAVRSRHGKS